MHIREAKKMTVEQELRPARDSNASLVRLPHHILLKWPNWPAPKEIPFGSFLRYSSPSNSRLRRSWRKSHHHLHVQGIQWDCCHEAWLAGGFSKTRLELWPVSIPNAPSAAKSKVSTLDAVFMPSQSNGHSCFITADMPFSTLAVIGFLDMMILQTGSLMVSPLSPHCKWRPLSLFKSSERSTS